MASVSVFKNVDVLVFFEKLYEAQQQKPRNQAQSTLSVALFISLKQNKTAFLRIRTRLSIESSKAVLQNLISILVKGLTYKINLFY